METEITPQSSDADVSKKRKTDSTADGTVNKKPKIDNNDALEDDDICIIEDSDSDMQCVYQKSVSPDKQTNKTNEVKSQDVTQVTPSKRMPQKHKPSLDDECLIIYDERDEITISPKKSKQSAE